MLESINELIRKENLEEFDGDLKNFNQGPTKTKKFRGKSKTNESKNNENKGSDKISNIFGRKNSSVNLNNLYAKETKTDASSEAAASGSESPEEKNETTDSTTIITNASEDILNEKESKETSLNDEEGKEKVTSNGEKTSETEKTTENEKSSDISKGVNKFEENVNSTKSSKNQKDPIANILNEAAPFILNDLPNRNKKSSSKKKDKKKSRSHSDIGLDNLLGNGGIIVITQSFHHNDNDSVK